MVHAKKNNQVYFEGLDDNCQEFFSRLSDKDDILNGWEFSTKW